MSTAILWFRRDLRLADHPALRAAAKAHTRLLPIYIDDPNGEGLGAGGAASRWWLHHALCDVREQLRALGSDILLFQGDSEAILEQIQTETQAEACYWNRLYEPAITARDRRIKAAWKARGLAAHSFKAGLWFEPWELQTGKGEAFRVFTPYWKQLLRSAPDAAPLPAPDALPPLPEPIPSGQSLDALALLPHIPWDAGFHTAWDTPTEAGGAQRLRRFADVRLEAYAAGRNRPATDGVSRLSPYLRCGQLSPRQCAAVAAPVEGMDGPWIRELAWREFAYHVLYHYPHTATRPMNPRFERFPWAEADAETLNRWRRGQTGVPLVDAGLRALWATGWMHNRVRMVVASFLTKNLLIRWQEGAAWFMDTLVDADLANNTLGWQWTAGCGADAAPYFRVFNPVLQGEKFDPDGAYVRRWIPELADTPDRWVHQPWAAPSKPSGYPAPMVDLKASRARALEHFHALPK